MLRLNFHQSPDPIQGLFQLPCFGAHISGQMVIVLTSELAALIAIELLGPATHQ